MAKSEFNKVALLISTLTKAEKRFFKLANQSAQQQNFIDLFDIYEKKGSISDSVISVNYPHLTKQQLPNIRRHLYTKLLISLRMQNQKAVEEIEIRQQIDFARILYDKGLYIDALSILNKCKQKASEQNKNILNLEILFFEKAIESQNITKSIRNRAQELINQSNDSAEKVSNILEYSNLGLELYAYFLKNGFCKSISQQQEIETAYAKKVLKDIDSEADFYSKIYWRQSRCWYYYIRQEFTPYFEEAKQWLQVFQEHEKMIDLRKDFYFKSLHNVISGSFLCKKPTEFTIYFEELRTYFLKHEKQLTWNETGITKLYFHMHELDGHFLSGDFSKYDRKELKKLLLSNPYHWDKHRLAVFYYKLGCLEFGLSNYSEAVDEFHAVTMLYKSNSKSMVLLFSKILLAFSHLELNHVQLVQSMVLSLQKELNKREDYRPLERELAKLLAKLCQVTKADQKLVFQESLMRIRELKKDVFSTIAFHHFFAEEWIESKIKGVAAQQVIKERYNSLNKK